MKPVESLFLSYLSFNIKVHRIESQQRFHLKRSKTHWPNQSLGILIAWHVYEGI